MCVGTGDLYNQGLRHADSGSAPSPAQGSYAEASATPMEGGTMSIPSLSSHLIASARCYRHDYLVIDQRRR
jgi:hypothetical protein